MHATTARSVDEIVRGRDRRRRRPEVHHDRRHALRRQRADRARVDELPRPRHLRRRRAEDEGRPGQARCRPPAPLRGGSDLPRDDATRRPGRRIISGMGELHLEIIVDRLKREFNVDANVGRPQVAYRETVSKPAEKVQGKFVRQTGGSRPVRRRHHQPVSADAGRRLRVLQQDRRRNDSEGVHPGGRRGHPRSDGRGRPGRLSRSSTSRSRSSTGRTTTSTRARWPSRSPARWRSRKRLKRAKPVLLEPVMVVEVTTPEEYLGDVIGDLNGRRGQVEGMEPRRQRTGRSGPWCRWPRCSATPPTFAR